MTAKFGKDANASIFQKTRMSEGMFDFAPLGHNSTIRVDRTERAVVLVIQTGDPDIPQIAIGLTPQLAGQLAVEIVEMAYIVSEGKAPPTPPPAPDVKGATE